MPKPYSFPTLFDEIKSFSITDLKRLGYIHYPLVVTGIIQWKNNFDEVTGAINIYVHLMENEQFINLSYTAIGETEYNYKVLLEALPSNLGKGDVWYFICPFTLQRCRKLHLIQGRFMHRSALKTGMYSTQIKSKQWRRIDKVYGVYFALDRNYSQLHAKHFKKRYKGKPTKRYLKLIQKISQAEKIPIEDIERLLMGVC